MRLRTYVVQYIHPNNPEKIEYEQVEAEGAIDAAKQVRNSHDDRGDEIIPVEVYNVH